MSHKFLDVVLYNFAGVSTKALVIHSQIQPLMIQPPDADPENPVTEEHLTLVTLDPSAEGAVLSGIDLSTKIKTIFNALPLASVNGAGWTDISVAAISPDAALEAKIAELESENAELKAKINAIAPVTVFRGVIDADGHAEIPAAPAEVSDATIDEAAEDSGIVEPAPTDNPAPVTETAIAEQNEHDHATGNVDEHGQTPAEAVAAEAPKSE